MGRPLSFRVIERDQTVEIYHITTKALDAAISHAYGRGGWGTVKIVMPHLGISGYLFWVDRASGYRFRVEGTSGYQGAKDRSEARKAIKEGLERAIKDALSSQGYGQDGQDAPSVEQEGTQEPVQETVAPSERVETGEPESGNFEPLSGWVLIGDQDRAGQHRASGYFVGGHLMGVIAVDFRGDLACTILQGVHAGESRTFTDDGESLEPAEWVESLCVWDDDLSDWIGHVEEARHHYDPSVCRTFNVLGLSWQKPMGKQHLGVILGDPSDTTCTVLEILPVSEVDKGCGFKLIAWTFQGCTIREEIAQAQTARDLTRRAVKWLATRGA